MPDLCPVCGAAHAVCGPVRPTRFIPLGLPHGGEPNPEYDGWQEMDMLQTTRAAVPRQGDFTANERLFLDAEGNVVDENSPDKNSLLVAKGGIISAADVERFGVTDRVTAYDPEAAIREAESGEAFANTAPQTNEDGTAKSGEGEQIARDVQAQEDAAPARSTRTAEKAADEPEKADSGDAGKGESRSSSKR